MSIESVLPVDDPKMSKTKDSDYEQFLANKARTSAHRMVDKAADTAVNVESNLRDKAGTASEAFADGKESAEYRVKREYINARRKAQEHPLLTLGIAFAAGAVLGKLMSR